jgi:hypothetical protein
VITGMRGLSFQFQRFNKGCQDMVNEGLLPGSDY